MSFQDSKGFSSSLRLQRECQQSTVRYMKRSVMLLLTLVLLFHVGTNCSALQPGMSISSPCCGAKCPMSPSHANGPCCEIQESSPDAQITATKPDLVPPSLRSYLVERAPQAIVSLLASVVVGGSATFNASPPGAVKLSLLCSRQI